MYPLVCMHNLDNVEGGVKGGGEAKCLQLLTNQRGGIKCQIILHEY